MDFLSFLGGINIVAVIFFIPVLGFVVFELGMVIKESSAVSTKQPTVPKFDPNAKLATPLTQSAQLSVQPHMTPITPHKKNRLVPLIIAFILLIGLGGFILINPPIGARSQKPEIIPQDILTPQPTDQMRPVISPTAVPTTTTTLPTVAPTGVSNKTKKSSVSSISSTTQQVEPTKGPENLPQAGSYHSILMLSIVATGIITLSFIF